MSVFGKLIEGVTGGLVHEVTKEDEAPPVNVHGTEGQVLPQPPPAQTRKTVGTESAASERAKRDLESVLGATPEKFQLFLERKMEFADVLADAGTSPGKIEEVATAKALKAARLTLTDMNAAMTAAKGNLQRLRTDFSGALEAERETQVEQPTAGIRQTETEIKNLRDQIARLEGEIAKKEASIQPAQGSIKRAEEDLARGQAIFDASCEKVEAVLRAMETQILQCLQQPPK